MHFIKAFSLTRIMSLSFRYIFTLYLMSDCYLGLDQQYDIYLNVIKANISTKDSDVFTDLSV